MARELPRTLATLWPPVQHGLSDGQLGISVVDNGSTPPVPRPPESSVRLIRIDPAPPSPVRAINIGIRAAAGDLIGVMIDGARMASPGLIRHAVLAAGLHPRPVI